MNEINTKVQRNVNVTIKDGLEKINDLVGLIAKDHSLASEREDKSTSGDPLIQKKHGKKEEKSARGSKTIKVTKDDFKRKRTTTEASIPEK